MNDGLVMVDGAEYKPPKVQLADVVMARLAWEESLSSRRNRFGNVLADYLTIAVKETRLLPVLDMIIDIGLIKSFQIVRLGAVNVIEAVVTDDSEEVASDVVALTLRRRKVKFRHWSGT